MLVSDLMSSPVYAIAPGDLISYARNRMLRHRISRLVILEDGRLVGLVTKKDLGYIHRDRNPGWRRRSHDNDPVSQVMSTDLISVSQSSSVRDAICLMVNHGVSGFPIVEQGLVIGILTKTDIMRSPPVQELKGRVSDLMNSPRTVSGIHSLDHVIDRLKNGTGMVVVLDPDGAPVGIISDSDIAFFEDGGERDELVKAEDIMRSPVFTLHPQAEIRDAVDLMVKQRISSVLIKDGFEIKGIITRDDIIREVAQ